MSGVTGGVAPPTQSIPHRSRPALNCALLTRPPSTLCGRWTARRFTWPTAVWPLLLAARSRLSAGADCRRRAPSSRTATATYKTSAADRSAAVCLISEPGYLCNVDARISLKKQLISTRHTICLTQQAARHVRQSSDIASGAPGLILVLSPWPASWSPKSADILCNLTC